MCVGLRTTLLPKPVLPPLNQEKKAEIINPPQKPEVSANKESYSKEKREQNLVKTENSKSASFAPVTTMFKPLVVKTTLGDRLQTLMNAAEKQKPVTTTTKKVENGKTTWESSTKTEYKAKDAEKAKATQEKKYGAVYDKTNNSGELSRKSEVKDADGKTVVSHDTKATGSTKEGESQAGLGHTKTEGESKVLVQGGVKYTVAKPVAKGDLFAVTWSVEVSGKAGRSKDTEVKNPNAPEGNKNTKGNEISVGVTHTEKMTRTFKTQKEAMDFYRSNSMIPKPGVNKSDPLSLEVGESKSTADELKGTVGTNTKSSPKTFGEAINTGKKFNISGKMQVEITRPSKDIIEFEIMQVRGLSADTTKDKSKSEAGVDDKKSDKSKVEGSVGAKLDRSSSVKLALKVNTPEGKELLKQLLAKPEATMERIMADLNSGKEVKGASLVKDAKTKEKEITASAKVTVGVVSVGAKFNLGNKLAVEINAVSDKKVDIQLTKTNTIGGEVSAEAKLGSPHEKVPVSLGSVGASANAKKESTDSVKISIDRTNPAGEALYIELKKNPEATMAKIVAKLKAGQQVPGVNLLEESKGDTVTKGYKINFFDKLSVSGGSDLAHKTTTKKDEKGNTVVVNDNAASRSAGAAFEGFSPTLPFSNKHIEILPKASYERKSAFTAQDENGKLKTASLQVTVNTTELESAARDLATATNTGWNFEAVQNSKGVKYNANWTVKYNLSEEQMDAIIKHVDSGKSLMLYHHSSTEVEPIKDLERALKATGGDKPAQYRLLSEFIEKTQHYGIQTILETMKRNGVPTKELDLNMSVKNANEGERINLPIGSQEKTKLRGKMEQYMLSAKDGSMSKAEIKSAITKDIDAMKKWVTQMGDEKQFPELPRPIRERVKREAGENIEALEKLTKELGL